MHDDQDWLVEIADVTPLDKKHIQPPKPEIQQRKNHGLTADIPYVVPVDDPEPFNRLEYRSQCLSGARVSVDGKTFSRLKKGEISYASVLDLHGLTEQDAPLHLTHFLQNAVQNGSKCVLVVHGKGQGFGDRGDMGLLKANMVKWLIGNGLVRGFHSCVPRHGGSGALYVLLKKKEE